MNEEIFNKFIAEFKYLQKRVAEGIIPERELFALTATFNRETGGRLSQYNSPLAVGVAVVPVEKDGEQGFIALKRGINPFIGGIAFPGGFVDQQESSKEAAIRELNEEIGLTLDEHPKWQHVGEKKTPNNQLLIFYRYAETLKWDDVVKAYQSINHDKTESQDIVFLEPSTEMCFSLHKEIHQEQLPKPTPRMKP